MASCLCFVLILMRVAPKPKCTGLHKRGLSTKAGTYRRLETAPSSVTCPASHRTALN